MRAAHKPAIAYPAKEHFPERQLWVVVAHAMFNHGPLPAVSTTAASRLIPLTTRGRIVAHGKFDPNFSVGSRRGLIPEGSVWQAQISRSNWRAVVQLKVNGLHPDGLRCNSPVRVGRTSVSGQALKKVGIGGHATM